MHLIHYPTLGGHPCPRELYLLLGPASVGDGRRGPRHTPAQRAGSLCCTAYCQITNVLAVATQVASRGPSIYARDGRSRLVGPLLLLRPIQPPLDLLCCHGPPGFRWTTSWTAPGPHGLRSAGPCAMRAERSLLVPVGGRELGHWRRRELRGMGGVGGGGVAASGGGGGSGGSGGRDGSGGGGNGVGTHSCFPRVAWRTHGGGSGRVQGRLPGAAAFPQFVQGRAVGSGRFLHVESIPVTALRIGSEGERLGRPNAWPGLRHNANLRHCRRNSLLPRMRSCSARFAKRLTSSSPLLPLALG